MAAPPPGLVLLALTPRVLRRVALVCTAVVAALLLGNLVSIGLRDGLGYRWGMGLVPLLDTAEERSAGTWAATHALLLSALVCLVASRTAARRSVRRGWLLVAVVLALMSFDEVGTVHEELSNGLQQRLDLQGYLYFAWVWPALALGALFLAVQLRFLLALPRPAQRGLLAAGVVFVSGAAGLELLQSAIYSAEQEFTLTYRVLAMVEETLELSGVLILLNTALREMARNLPGAALVLAPGPADQARPELAQP